MKTRIINLLIPLFAGSATSALASDGSLNDGGGPLVWFFIGFGALVLMLQAVPALIMLYSMVKGALSPADHTVAATGQK